MTEYVCAVDAGGTFTDCILIDDAGEVTTAKALTTPEAGIEEGVFDSIDAAAAKLGYEAGEVYDDLVRLAHGTTVATNVVVEENGVETGLLTTQGHEDTVRMMRGVGRVTGEPPENVFRVTEVDKPDPVVPPSLIEGVPGRIDADGNEVAPLDEAATREAVRDLLDAGVEAIAVSLLWSMKTPEHEERVAEIIEEEATRDVFVSLSHAVAPKVGEYERSVATCINSQVGPPTASYIGRLTAELDARYGYDGGVQLMQCNGGTAWPAAIEETPIKLIGSGPVGGLRGCEQLTETGDYDDVIATDMGGTSFELGIVEDGDALVTDETVIRKYQYNLPRLDVKSIGAGGGSIARVDPDSGALKVGPDSAGADPGPACYGLGGTEATVTDANLVLGYIDSEAEFGDELTPDLDRAREALDGLADELGLTVEETALGVFEVTNTKMANLMESEVIGRGFDPRDFVVVSYGGAGPIHAAAYASQLNVDRVVVPSEVSPVWSAYGIAGSDGLYQFERELSLVEPFDAEELSTAFADLESEARSAVADGAADVDPDNLRFERVGKLRYEDQVNDIETTFPAGEFGPDELSETLDGFRAEYERRYSPAARLEAAREELVSLRVNARVPVAGYDRATATPVGSAPPDGARTGERAVYDGAERGRVDVPVYDGTALEAGNELAGPVLVDLPNTTVVGPEGTTVSVNEYGDFEIEL